MRITVLRLFDDAIPSPSFRVEFSIHWALQLRRSQFVGHERNQIVSDRQLVRIAVTSRRIQSLDKILLFPVSGNEKELQLVCMPLTQSH
jgi:hypothetical protein